MLRSGGTARRNELRVAPTLVRLELLPYQVRNVCERNEPVASLLFLFARFLQARGDRLGLEVARFKADTVDVLTKEILQRAVRQFVNRKGRDRVVTRLPPERLRAAIVVSEELDVQRSTDCCQAGRQRKRETLAAGTLCEHLSAPLERKRVQVALEVIALVVADRKSTRLN